MKSQARGRASFCLVMMLSATVCSADACAAGETDARTRHVEQKLAEIWSQVNQRWRDHGQKRVTQVQVAPLDLKPLAPPPEFAVPQSARNVTARDGIYDRDGRPAFLIGVEGRMYDGPWINRILGLDFYQQHSGMVWWRGAAQVSPSPGPRGGLKMTVSFRDYPWAGILAREVLGGGTLLTVDYYLGKSNESHLSYKKYRFDPPFFGGPKDSDRGTDHFLNLHLENPEAFAYYTSQYAVVSRLLEPYPILHHELVNEVGYNSYWAGNIVAFQDRMREKYGTIETANAAWRTKFARFDDVIPPLTTDPPGFYWLPPTEGRGFTAGNILADWSRFMAQHSAEIFGRLRQAAGQVAKNTLFTIQSPYVHGELHLLPHLKAQAEDVYGHETFFYPYRSGEPGQEDWAKVLVLMSMQYDNDLARNAAPDKPIVNLESPWIIKRAHYAAGRLGIKEPGEPGGANFMRMFFWHQAVHGVSGSVLSYFYTNESSDGGYSAWDPAVMNRDAVREIPRVDAEIRDLATVVLPRPRIRGKLAIVHSFETVMEERARRDFFKESMTNYGAAVLTRVPVDVIKAQDIVDGKAGEYPVLVLNHCIRFPRAGLAKLREYVEGGGSLVVTFDSLAYDEYVQPFDLTEFLGAKRAGAVPAGAKAELKVLGLEETAPAVTAVTSPGYGYRLQLAGAEGLGSSPAGPPISVGGLGKGRVYYVGWNLPAPAMRGLLSYVCRQAGVAPAVDVRFDDGIAADYVETHRFGPAQAGRHVVYALNFGGGPRKARLVPAALGATSVPYYVRSVRPPAYLAPNGEARQAAWSASDFARGIPATLPAQDPELFLVERTDLAPLPLQGLTAEQTDVLRWAWRDSPASKRRVLVDGYHVAEFRVSKPKMPTAVKALEDAGWEVNSLISRLGDKVTTFSSKGVTQEDLSSYQVLAFCGLNHGTRVWHHTELERLVQFVAGGGGLIACLKRDWHSEAMFYEDLQAFGIGDAGATLGPEAGEPTGQGGNVYDPKNCIRGEPVFVGLRPAADHPITAGVTRFQTTGIRPLIVTNPAAKTLFASEPGAGVMNLWSQRRAASRVPVAAALEHGRGRVVVVGADTWLRPDELELADNRRLLLNMIRWVGKQPADPP